ncbi:hypothetical protein FB451DRAFT_1563454 [Mycena latifolia]|nr:hypothetical protein FB451DRAFT_1563454 [Mycena latifolia]
MLTVAFCPPRRVWTSSLVVRPLYPARPFFALARPAHPFFALARPTGIHPFLARDCDSPPSAARARPPDLAGVCLGDGAFLSLPSRPQPASSVKTLGDGRPIPVQDLKTLQAQDSTPRESQDAPQDAQDLSGRLRKPKGLKI